MTPSQLKFARLVGLALAVLFVLPGIFRPQEWHFLNNVNLIFHEAGHVLLGFFGETVMLLGGSLMQVVIPFGLTVAFFLRGERYSAGIVSLWLAQSFANVSVYVRDAPTRNLDLITGDPDTHDWWQLLSGWNPLDNHLGWAAPLANFMLFLALASLIVGVLMAVWDDLQ